MYENGVLRPLEPLPLPEHQQVTVMVTDGASVSERCHLDADFMDRVKKEVETMDHIPTHEEARQATSKDPSSWAELIIAEREDRF